MTTERTIDEVTSPTSAPRSTHLQEAAVTDHPEPPPGAGEGITCDEAHQIMQDHINCDRSCAMRAAALHVLVDSGRYTLAS
jgi:hypothetical protein